VHAGSVASPPLSFNSRIYASALAEMTPGLPNYGLSVWLLELEFFSVGGSHTLRRLCLLAMMLTVLRVMPIPMSLFGLRIKNR
jgi:hypothetical protein